MESVRFNVEIFGWLVEKSFINKETGDKIDYYYLLDDNGNKTKVASRAYKAFKNSENGTFYLANGKICFRAD